MHPAIIALVAVFATVLGVFLLWLVLIAPRARKRAVQPFLRPYAHRGLWGDTAPENSLAAFELAVKAGFAIELDVQLSRDGEVMVFHDYTLTRMCGKDVKLASLTAAELAACTLGNSKEHIPTLAQVLALVGGSVPLLIELKGESGDTALCPAVAALLDAYKGEWCVESFNPLLLRWFKKHRRSAVRGLLSTDLIKEKKSGSRVLNFALSALWLTFLCRPAFHAWNQHYPSRLALRCGIKCFGAASLVYTVKNQADYDRQLSAGNYPIFDGFVPR
ncbi:MAG: glycerophosphodiester phosphodiesterase [Clostridia bacterium]|nr:glycerophosphodiester phosphodiesterase [Clostridia bacterium]